MIIELFAEVMPEYAPVWSSCDGIWSQMWQEIKERWENVGKAIRKEMMVQAEEEMMADAAWDSISEEEGPKGKRRN